MFVFLYLFQKVKFGRPSLIFNFCVVLLNALISVKAQELQYLCNCFFFFFCRLRVFSSYLITSILHSLSKQKYLICSLVLSFPYHSYEESVPRNSFGVRTAVQCNLNKSMKALVKTNHPSWWGLDPRHNFSHIAKKGYADAK